jgi:D-galactarolactone isomerase
MPDFACDSHMHVFDRRFPTPDSGPRLVQHATAADYRSVQRRLGTMRTVVVTPRMYMTDNAVTLDAIEQLGKARTRGVAVIRPEVTDAQLRQLHDAGIRGIRFTLYTPRNAVTGFDMVEALAHRVNELGWHVQLHWTADQLVEHEAMLTRLPSKIVFDHLARLPVSQGISHPAFAIVRALLDAGRSWLKLSGPYLDSAVGEEGAYADSDAVARTWVRVASDRLVWGSDWPHITEMPAPPPTLLMREVLRRWVDDEATMHRVLVDNPMELYGFDDALEPTGNNGVSLRDWQ